MFRRVVGAASAVLLAATPLFAQAGGGTALEPIITPQMVRTELAGLVTTWLIPGLVFVTVVILGLSLFRAVRSKFRFR